MHLAFPQPLLSVALRVSHLAVGFIAILGRPNAGKSTLVNGMVGQKLSIVTAKAQTTRHRILSLISEPDYQMIFLDTPGIMNVIFPTVLMKPFLAWTPYLGYLLTGAECVHSLQTYLS